MRWKTKWKKSRMHYKLTHCLNSIIWLEGQKMNFENGFWVITKQISSGFFKSCIDCEEPTIVLNEQVYMLFSWCRNHQFYWLERPYQKEIVLWKRFSCETKYDIVVVHVPSFCRSATSSPFFLHFCFAFMENLFKKRTISKLVNYIKTGNH